MSDRPSTCEVGGNIKRKKTDTLYASHKNQKYLSSVILFIGSGDVIVSVIVIVCVTGDRSGEGFLGGHEEGCD